MLRRTSLERRLMRAETINVLCCSGLDPTGGAGIQADIEAVAAQGAHALCVVTALTVQDTHNVSLVQPVAAALLAHQLSVLLADCTISAIKLGLLGEASQLPVLASVLRDRGKPVVIDPILRAGGGRELLDPTFAQQFAASLFPLCTVLTPNAAEARRWAATEDLDIAGARLLDMGAAQVLITGGDESSERVCNRWYGRTHQGARLFEFERIQGEFHGAGCTLAAAVAAQLAVGAALPDALHNAQRYVARTLHAARFVGQGRRVPHRVQGGRA